LDLVPATDLMGNWITWWVGDTLGVLVALPLMLVLVGLVSSICDRMLPKKSSAALAVDCPVKTMNMIVSVNMLPFFRNDIAAPRRPGSV
jgi:integral membrane sensor domain MASE1